MVCYDSHELLLALMSFLSWKSIEGDTAFSFSFGKQESKVTLLRFDRGWEGGIYSTEGGALFNG
jgi:hypothetical protein